MLLLTSCQSVPELPKAAVFSIDFGRLTYQVLRQGECLQYQLDSVCQRGYAHDYSDYLRKREIFLQELANQSSAGPARFSPLTALVSATAAPHTSLPAPSLQTQAAWQIGQHPERALDHVPAWRPSLPTLMQDHQQP